MRKWIAVRLGASDRKRLEAIDGSGSSAQKHVWRARIVLPLRISLLAIGLGSLFAATASAGSLVEFANLPERRSPATLIGYLARPDQGLSALLGPGAHGPKQYPAVVVLHGCDGLSSHIAGIADKLGSWGWRLTASAHAGLPAIAPAFGSIRPSMPTRRCLIWRSRISSIRPGSAYLANLWEATRRFTPSIGEWWHTILPSGFVSRSPTTRPAVLCNCRLLLPRC